MEVGGRTTEGRRQGTEQGDGKDEWMGGWEKRDRGQTTEVRKQGKGFGDLRFRSTFDIIAAAEKGLLPDKMMINTHPQRWDDRFGPWVKELVAQNLKNVIKKMDD